MAKVRGDGVVGSAVTAWSTRSPGGGFPSWTTQGHESLEHLAEDHPDDHSANDVGRVVEANMDATPGHDGRQRVVQGPAGRVAVAQEGGRAEGGRGVATGKAAGPRGAQRMGGRDPRREGPGAP